MSKHLLVFLALALFPACAAMQQDYQARVCTNEGAYQQGYNDGQAGRPMDSSFASICPTDPEPFRAAYRNGFTAGQAQKPVEIHIVNEGRGDAGWECRDSYGKQVCGYHCLEAYGKVRCARYPSHTCMEAYGQIHCGRHCHEEYGKVICEQEE